jgi:hypothetical protein
MLFRAEKILLMTIYWTHRASIFGPGPSLGRPPAHFSVKQHFGPGSGQKKFASFKISAHARPVRFVGGPGAGRACGPGRAELKMLRYNAPLAPRRLHHPRHIRPSGWAPTPSLCRGGSPALHPPLPSRPRRRSLPPLDSTRRRHTRGRTRHVRRKNT